MTKPLIFISHITEEREIAAALKKLVEAAFLNMIDVFVSSDPTSIKRGRRWLEEITSALRTCSIEIILASPESVKRPWINFEAGAGWIREIPVIPLCHSGMTPSKLPLPLGSLQASTATEEPELKLIFPVVAEAIGCQLPEIDFEAFISVVRTYEETSRQDMELKARVPIAATDGLSPHELVTLLEIAEASSSPGDYVGSFHIAERVKAAGYRKVASTLALSTLGRKALTELSTESDNNGNPYSLVRITEEGWAWIDANQDKLSLTIPPRNEFVDDVSGKTFKEDDIPF